MRQRLLPNPHPDLARSLNNLAVLLRRKDRSDEAEPLYREALAMRRKLLGPEHGRSP
jgi:Flp pilus assembly protein TadD